MPALDMSAPASSDAAAPPSASGLSASQALPLLTDLLSSPPRLVTVNPGCGASLHAISNAHFEGRLMLKLRPPHLSARKPHKPPAAAASAAAAGQCASASADGECGCCEAFFDRYPGVQLELAVQGRFLQAVSQVWMGAELGGPAPFTLQLPFLKRAAVRMMAGVIAAVLPNVKSSLGDARTEEYPLVSFPLVSAMDCVVATPLSSAAAAPPLDWRRLPVDGSHRKSLSFDSRFDTSHLYTLAFYSDQLDLARWKAVNVPGLSDVDLRSVWLQHPLTLHAYTLVDATGPHSQANRRTLFAVQLQPPHDK